MTTPETTIHPYLNDSGDPVRPGRFFFRSSLIISLDEEYAPPTPDNPNFNPFSGLLSDLLDVVRGQYDERYLIFGYAPISEDDPNQPDQDPPYEFHDLFTIGSEGGLYFNGPAQDLEALREAGSPTSWTFRVYVASTQIGGDGTPLYFGQVDYITVTVNLKNIDESAPRIIYDDPDLYLDKQLTQTIVIKATDDHTRPIFQFGVESGTGDLIWSVEASRKNAFVGDQLDGTRYFRVDEQGDVYWDGSPFDYSAFGNDFTDEVRFKVVVTDGAGKKDQVEVVIRVEPGDRSAIDVMATSDDLIAGDHSIIDISHLHGRDYTNHRITTITDNHGNRHNISTEFSLVRELDYSTGQLRWVTTGELKFTGSYDSNIKYYVITISATHAGQSYDLTITLYVNEAPVITSTHTNAVSIAENADKDTLITTIIANDPDGQNTDLRYAITAGNIGFAFAINNRGQLKVNNASQLDYETRPSYTLTIAVTDPHGAVAETHVTIALTNVNDSPVIISDHSADHHVSKQADLGTFITKIMVDNPEGAAALSFSITAGNTGNHFAIDHRGNITLAAALPASGADRFDLTITINDGPHTLTQQLVIVVNETAPLITSSHAATLTFAEDTALGTLITTVAVQDADNDNLSYAIIAGDPGDYFAIDQNGVITLKNNFDYESHHDFTLTVQVSDGVHLVTETITIAVTDVNDVRPVITGNHRGVAPRSTPIGTEIITVTARDEDSPTLTYRIISGNDLNLFAIDANTGVITLATEFTAQTKKRHQLTVDVSDGDFSTQAVIDIHINDTQPSFQNVWGKSDSGSGTVIGKDTITLTENEVSGIENKVPGIIAFFTATDADGDRLSFSIISGDPLDAFQVRVSSNGFHRLIQTKPLDYETAPQLVLTIQVSDGTFTDERIFTINVRDVIEPPVITSDHQTAISLSEDAVNDHVVTQITAEDADNDDTSLRFEITAGNINNAFSIDDMGNIKVADATQLDFETQPNYTLTITVTDLQGVTAQTTVLITMTDINEPHVITSDHGEDISLIKSAEIGALITHIMVDNPEGLDALTFRITSGDTNALFAIDPEGRITLARAVTDSDSGRHVLTVEVSDADYRLEQNIAIDVNAYVPQITSQHDQPINLAENVELDRMVSTITATDGDQDDLQFAIISGNDDSHFAIDEQGVIRLKKHLDAEEKTQFTLTVEVSDGGNTETVDVIVNVTNVNDVAPVITSNHDAIVVLRKNASMGTVARIEASDEDNANLTYSISRISNPHDLFSIDQNGVISLNHNLNQQLFNNGLRLNYDLVVNVSDGTFSDSVTVKIAFNDHAPYLVNNRGQDSNGLIYSFPGYQLTDAITINENQTAGVQLGLMHASDRDGDSLRMTIAEGNEDGIFRITSAGKFNGIHNFHLNLINPLDYESQSQHVLVIRLTDGFYQTDTRFTVNVMDDVSEIPMLITAGDGRVVENISGVNTGISFSFSDLSTTSALAWNITGDGASLFEVVPNADQAGQWILKLKANTALDFEAFANHQLTVTASQGSVNLTSVVNVVVNKVYQSHAMGSYATEPHELNYIYLKEDFAGHPDNIPILHYFTDDLNGGPASFRIISGDADNVFAFTTQGDKTGILQLVKPLDYENHQQYDLIIEITDGAFSEQRSFSIMVDDVATLITTGNGLVDENIAGAETGIILTFDDLNANAHLAWHIAGDQANLFEIVPHATLSGQWVLKLKPNVSLDYESQHLYELTITATQGRMRTEKAVTITVNDVNDDPPIFSEQSYSGAVREDIATGQVIPLNPMISLLGAVSSNLTYSIISGNDAGLFSINNSGELMLAAGLDFETATIHQLRIKVSDGINHDEADVTVHVTNVDDGPAVIGITGAAGVDLTNLAIGDTVNAAILTPDPDGTAPNTISTWRWFHAHKPDVTIGTGDSYMISNADRGAQIAIELTYTDKLDAVIVGKTDTKAIFVLDDVVPRLVHQQTDAEKEEDKAITLPDTATEVDAGDGSDTITGGDGNDEIIGGKGDDNIDLGETSNDRDTVIYGIGDRSAKDGGDTITNFNRGVDQFVFSLENNTDTAGITDYDHFLQFITKGTDTIDDDEFMVQLDLGMDGNGNTQLEGLYFHFSGSSFFSGGRVSLPLMKISFAEPVDTAGITDIFSDATGQAIDPGNTLNEYLFLTDFDYLDDLLGGMNSIHFMIAADVV